MPRSLPERVGDDFVRVLAVKLTDDQFEEMIGDQRRIEGDKWGAGCVSHDYIYDPDALIDALLAKHGIPYPESGAPELDYDELSDENAFPDVDEPAKTITDEEYKRACEADDKAHAEHSKAYAEWQASAKGVEWAKMYKRWSTARDTAWDHAVAVYTSYDGALDEVLATDLPDDEEMRVILAAVEEHPDQKELREELAAIDAEYENEGEEAG